jgi:hypothetical protein
MKKILFIVSIMSAPFISFAQDSSSQPMNMDVFRVISMIFMAALFMLFVITVMKRIFEFRLKNKVMDKGISETIISTILSTNPNEDRNANLKWATILAGIGVGLTIINYTLPLGFHSLAIMAFSIAFSFICYYFLIRYLDK